MGRVKVPGLPDLLLFLGTALFPVYVFPPGSLQPSHIFLALFALLWFCRYGFKIRGWATLLLLLATHIILVELFYAISTEFFYGTMNFLFVVFNLLVALAITDYVQKNGVYVVKWGVVVAASIALMSSVIDGVSLTEFTERGRESGAFNNPNQLGFFSVCLLSFAYLLYIEKKISYVLAAGLFFISAFLAILSLSKAAVGAILGVLWLALRPRLTGKTLLLWASGVLVVVGVLLNMYLQGAFDHYLFVNRMQNISNEDDSSLASRGYFIFLGGNFLQVLFGLGQYNVFLANRWHEVHSSIASMLNNYGVVGMALFVAVLGSWVHKTFSAFGWVGCFCITFPYFLYSITHNGTRFSFFWILFASSMAIAYEKSSRAARSPHGSVVTFRGTGITDASRG